MTNENLITFVFVFLISLGLLHVIRPGAEITSVQPQFQQQFQQPEMPPLVSPRTPKIASPIPAFLPYDRLRTQLVMWNQEAMDLTEIGVIGKTTRGLDIPYMRITNKLGLLDKPKVLVTGCIHGNEPHATATVMAYMGTLLSQYGTDPEVTKLLDERDIYFVPLLSPDSYPSSRYVDNVDPNRDFDNRKSSPVRAIQEFFQKHNFKAALSGHTWGRVFLIPPGNSMTNSKDHAKYETILTEMSSLSKYRWMRACDMYKSGGGLANPPIRYGEDDWSVQKAMVPIYGTEVDWYYEHGAFKTLPNGKSIKSGCFAIVMEFGTHQRIPTMEEINYEFKLTWTAFLHFLKEAPMVEIWWDEAGRSVNPDGTPK